MRKKKTVGYITNGLTRFGETGLVFRVMLLKELFNNSINGKRKEI